MHRLRRLLRRRPEEFVLFFRVSALVWAIRLGLWVLPFPTLRKLVAKAAAVPARNRRHATKYFENNTQDTHLAIGQLKWAVQAASHYVPEATCLTQALTMQILLARCGYDTRVHIGVAKGVEGKFEAHAWVEDENQIIIGGGGDQRWTPLTTLDVERP